MGNHLREPEELSKIPQPLSGRAKTQTLANLLGFQPRLLVQRLSSHLFSPFGLQGAPVNEWWTWRSTRLSGAQVMLGWAWSKSQNPELSAREMCVLSSASGDKACPDLEALSYGHTLIPCPGSPHHWTPDPAPFWYSPIFSTVLSSQVPRILEHSAPHHVIFPPPSPWKPKLNHPQCFPLPTSHYLPPDSVGQFLPLCHKSFFHFSYSPTTPATLTLPR
jgi:hypothetical protein